MKTYTQDDYDGFPVVDGVKLCPAGDYSEVKTFVIRSRFGAKSRFSTGAIFYGCSFKWSHFERSHFDECSFNWCHLDECSFERSHFDECSLEWCSFERSHFEQCHFDECIFGGGLNFEGRLAKPGYPLLKFGGGGSENRTIYCFNTVEGLIFRAGCFVGSKDEFVEKVLGDDESPDKSNLKTKQYMGFVDLCELTFK